MPVTLILGGARSGKSRTALTLAKDAAAGSPCVFIATAKAFDDEMSERIHRHKLERDDRWTTREIPLALSEALGELTAQDTVVVDCLTLWLTNLILSGGAVDQACADLTAAASRCPARLFFVSNEVGWGIVPDNALARQFQDAAGRLHQDLAAVSDRVLLVVAGQSLELKPLARPAP